MSLVNSKNNFVLNLGIILGLIIIVSLIFFYIYLPMVTHHGESIQVPDLKGLTFEEMENRLDQNGLRYQIIDSSFIAGTPALTVLSQNPKAGAEVKSSRIIYLSVASKMAPIVNMPYLKDKALKTAEIELKSLGLVLDKVVEVPYDFSNAVVRQLLNGNEIQAGTKLPKGSRITLEVGNGIPQENDTTKILDNE